MALLRKKKSQISPKRAQTIGQKVTFAVLRIRGNDRTGIITLLLLALVGVMPEDMIADYELSPDPEREEMLLRNHSSVREAILGALAGLDIESYLRMGGVSASDLAVVRHRLLG